ncbi:MAG: bifunctional metallophosphatase/5'-nucleotidase [Hydrotalea flava]|uniref:bifunctional metallophosphatase/5'-nucleotidase n=1 Tax=Hydrotalea TaxID=1004300 RepID=UPI000AAB9500|nr:MULTISPECIES: metallophosphatase [Hydrotalea]MBY0347032.1 metallophosphatase [Hydrotalea flava]NIM34361.1 bifunctional metallophosphatase/5'-nucleotidase [Hydrotalea flava]NIM37187.1 bifunctional metallophosphatase/5'-nucleotidase [Hydrotalea flava]NIN02380.1 bifunctional metallophosphatase/5'-nucleotidase [Hydrotalea flava]NIN14032.1 bifunctional metallophosphatase/5'-nucleotidase [Hydrotalea flava]
MNRRTFIQNTFKAGLFTGISILPASSLLAKKMVNETYLTLLHTNDTHSQIFPFESNSGHYAGMGGIESRKRMIEQIRSKGQPTLLLDAGDFCGDRPIYDAFKGKAELEAMRLLGYDAFTLGEKDFSGGIDNLATQIQATGMKPTICNYDFTYTALQNYYQPYTIIHRENLKIGVLGVLLPLHDKISISGIENLVYLDAVEQANKTANILQQQQCDIIICLSHLGDRYADGRISDEVLAKNNDCIDVIIGGHTHKFFNQPRVYQNKSSGHTLVNQAGWGGIQMGQLDYVFTNTTHKKLIRTRNIFLKEKKNE